MFLPLLVAATVAQEPVPTVMRHVALVPAESVAVHMAGSSAAPVSGGPVLPVVLVPGLVGSAYGFRHIIPDLAARGPVYVIDPLGTGSSSSPEDADYSLTAQSVRIGDVASALGVRRAIFACHSTGASMCYRLAHDRPGLVAGIVSINGGPTENVKTPGLSLALTFAPLISLFGGDGWARGKVEDGLKKSSADQSWVTDDVVLGYTAHYKGGVKAVLRTLKRMSDAKEPAPLAPMLPSIATPIHLLIGVGTTEGATKPEEIETLGTLPSFSVDSIAGAGQYIQEERPAAVVDAIGLMARLITPPPQPSVGRPTLRSPVAAEPPRPTSGGRPESSPPGG
jgi:pimeloyl-ACP methyl ester carboxylesterase